MRSSRPLASKKSRASRKFPSSSSLSMFILGLPYPLVDAMPLTDERDLYDELDEPKDRKAHSYALALTRSALIGSSGCQTISCRLALSGQEGGV